MSISAGSGARLEDWVGLAVGGCCEGKAPGCWAILVVNLCMRNVAISKNSRVSAGGALRPLMFVMAARRAEPSAWILA